MPNFFSLTPKGKSEPATFVDIDAAICRHLDVECHPVYWYKGWYDIIGLALATGRDFDWCRENLEGLDEVIDFLEANYEPNAWARIGKD